MPDIEKLIRWLFFALSIVCFGIGFAANSAGGDNLYGFPRLTSAIGLSTIATISLAIFLFEYLNERDVGFDRSILVSCLASMVLISVIVFGTSDFYQWIISGIGRILPNVPVVFDNTESLDSQFGIVSGVGALLSYEALKFEYYDPNASLSDAVKIISPIVVSVIIVISAVAYLVGCIVSNSAWFYLSVALPSIVSISIVDSLTDLLRNL